MEHRPASPAESPPTKRMKANTPMAEQETKPTSSAGPREPEAAAKPARRGGLTLASIESDSLTNSPRRLRGDVAGAWDEKVVEKIYVDELGGGSRAPNLQRVQLLEISQYLEKYLWPHFDAEKASATHVMSVMMMVNEKFREGVAAWTPVPRRAGEVRRFLQARDACEVRETTEPPREDRAPSVPGARVPEPGGGDGPRRGVAAGVAAAVDELVRGAFARGAEEQRAARETLALLAEEAGQGGEECGEGKQTASRAHRGDPGGDVVTGLVDDFFTVCEGAVAGDKVDRDAVRFCERFIEFTIDVLSQLPTRRFVRTVLDARQVLVKARMMPLFAAGRVSCTHAAG